MKLATIEHLGEPTLVVVDDQSALILKEVDERLPRSINDIPALGDWGLEAIAAVALENLGGRHRANVPLQATRLLAPVTKPGKVVAVGLNYHDHAKEAGATKPEQPIIFAKFPSAIIGPDEVVSWDPAIATEVDYEAELAIVIGRRARSVSVNDARDYVLGLTCANDISARDIQFGDGQWVRGKSLDGFCPMGPTIVTLDELKDPLNLRLSCQVNGAVLQESSTSDMIFDIDELVAYCSHYFSLEPGDVILTGTPAGVGFFRTPRKCLQDGDEIVVAIEGLGELRNTCAFVRAPSVAWQRSQSWS